MRMSTTTSVSLLLTLLLFAADLPAEIYKWVDEQGQVHYSDQKPDDRPVTKITPDTRTCAGVSYGTIEIDTPEATSKTERVVMLSASWCGTCKKARTYFRRNGIPFREYDIETSRTGKRLYDQLGARGVPVILVGDKRMNGFSEAGFQRMIR